MTINFEGENVWEKIENFKIGHYIKKSGLTDKLHDVKSLFVKEG